MGDSLRLGRLSLDQKTDFLTLGVLFGLGVYKFRIAYGNVLRGGLEVMGIGAFSGAAGYALGTLMPGLLRMVGIAIT